jgi:hypothetical protein
MNRLSFRVCLLIAIVWFTISPFCAFAQAPAQAQAQMTEANPEVAAEQKKLDEKLQAPFDFYGKVVDEKGQAVAGATATVTVMGEVGKAEGESKHIIKSDATGLFSLKGFHAFGVIVTVFKEGYLTIPNAHGPWSCAQGAAMPDSNNPAVFSLRLKHPANSLITIKARSTSFTDDGKSVAINLEPINRVPGNSGDMQVQAWVDSHDPGSNQPFHWKFRITIPGGGLVLSTDDYNFIAPSSGYQPSDEIDMTPDDPKWNNNCRRKYFVKLASGHYGRIEFFITPRGDHFIRVEGAINPSGSQNLEQ